MKGFFTKLIKNPIFINLILMAVASCVLLFVVLKWLDQYTHHNEAVVVPDVKGLELDEAAAFLHNNHLRYNVIDSVYSKDVAPGSVVELVPAAGSKVKEGRIVFVTINAMTAQMAIIPEVEDLSFRQAYALLKSRGFTTIEIKYVPGLYKDLAIAVEVNGEEIPYGDRIHLTAPLTLTVSSGDAFPPDSLELDSIPIEPLNSDIESWF